MFLSSLVCALKSLPLLSQVLMSYWPHVKKAVGASEKIFEYVDRKPEIPPDGTLAPQTLNGHVRFENITFAYPKRPDTNVLKVWVEKDPIIFHKIKRKQ